MWYGVNIARENRGKDGRMQIGITNLLREFLGWKPFPPNAEEPLAFCWDAHRVKVDGRVMLVVCNAANRFAGMTAMHGADWRRLGEVCRDLVVASMLECGFSMSAVDQYLVRAGGVEFGRTHGRRAVGCMNRLVDTLLWCECERGEQFQARLTRLVNFDDPAGCATREGYGYAAERMAEDLLKLGIRPHGKPRYSIDYSRVDEDEREAPEEEPEGGRPSTTAYPQGVETPDPSDGNAVSDITGRIDAVTRAMRAEREGDLGRPPAAGRLCTVCGAEPRVLLGGVSYCLGCYNEMAERLIGTPHVTNDGSTPAVYGEREVEQFAVERMVTPPFARWTARESVAEGDPRRAGGYEGVEACVDADPAEDQDVTLGRLWEKAQEAASQPSTNVHEAPAGFEWVSNGAHVGGKIRFANDSGWARIQEDEHGRAYVVVDGQRYGAEEFLGLFSGHIGFDFHWQMHDPGDDLPERWDMREDFERRGLV